MRLCMWFVCVGVVIVYENQSKFENQSNRIKMRYKEALRSYEIHINVCKYPIQCEALIKSFDLNMF